MPAKVWTRDPSTATSPSSRAGYVSGPQCHLLRRLVTKTRGTGELSHAYGEKFPLAGDSTPRKPIWEVARSQRELPGALSQERSW